MLLFAGIVSVGVYPEI